jgi:hypothetical protein
MRHEKKYKSENLHPGVVSQIIRNHPAGFRKVFPDRQINNVYFDTPNYMAYQENVDGVSDRRKFRVRWYGEDVRDVRNPQLEIKIKSNQLGRKETYPVDAFTLDDFEKVKRAVSAYSQLRLQFIPTLINSYHRAYYGTSDGKFRITVDWGLRYFSLLRARRFTNYAITDEGTVVELKYDEAMDEQSDWVRQYIPFRLTKSSKYVRGMNLTSVF